MATATKTKKPTLPEALKLNSTDREYLKEFEEQRDILAARTEAVAERAQNGLVVHGLPGVGKTVTVRRTLDRLKTGYVYRDGWVTAKGLFDTLDGNPSSVIVLDDLHSLLENKQAMQILLAALGGEIGETREITYTKSGSGSDGDCVHFSGGIIAINNMTIPDTALGAALLRRVCCFEFNPTQQELVAVLRNYANGGYSCAAGRMSPTECRAVVEFVLENIDALKDDAGVDFRVNYGTINVAYGDYLLRRGKNGLSWQTMILHHLRSSPKPKPVFTTKKKDRVQLERISFLKAFDENAKLPKSEQLTVIQLAKQLGINKNKAYAFKNGN